MEIKTSIKYDALKKLEKALKKKGSVKIGLLANKPGENGSKGSDSISNDIDLAGLGAVQEFGARIQVTDKMRGFFRHNFGINLKKDTEYIEIPARPFLGNLFSNQMVREAIMNAVNISGDADFDAEYAKYKLLDNPDFIKDLCTAIGAEAVKMIHEEFRSSGFGEWAPNSPMTIENKGSAMPLIDKGRLRGAITYEVEDG